MKGVRLTTAVKHFVKKALGGKKKGSGDLAQKGTGTSLIERFMYPKFGPGQLWEHVADQICKKGGEIHMRWKVDRIHCLADGGVKGVVSIDAVHQEGARRRVAGDYLC